MGIRNQISKPICPVFLRSGIWSWGGGRPPLDVYSDNLSSVILKLTIIYFTKTEDRSIIIIFLFARALQRPKEGTLTKTITSVPVRTQYQHRYRRDHLTVISKV